MLHNAQNFHKVLILGDLNSNLLNPTCRQAVLLHHLMNDFVLSDLFQGPTRVTESSCSHLDVFLTNNSCSFGDVSAVPCGFSDHHVVFGNYYCRRTHGCIGHKVIHARCYSKLDPLLLQDMLSEDSVWCDVLSFDDIDDSVLCFTTVLEGLLDFLVPLCKIRIKQFVNPWATGGDITAARHHRDGFYRRALPSGCQSDWKLFHDARNRVNDLLRSAKRRYIEELISRHGGHPSKFWSYFRYISSKGRKSEFATDFNFHADDLNAHFLSIPKRTVQDLPFLPVSPVSYLSEIDVPPLCLTTVTEEVVISAICGLDSKKATGCDKLPIRFLKTCPEAMGRLLTVLVNKNISTGRFPKLWKSAIVSPVQKSTDCSAMTNF